MRTHAPGLETGEKEFKCTLCNFQCNWKVSLKNHIRTHSEETPSQCGQCNLTSVSWSTMRDHKRAHNSPFRCTKCDYLTGNSSALKRHERTHTSDRPYKCDLCDYAAARRITLKSHQWTHTAERSFKCDYQSSKKSTLRHHKRTHIR